MRAGKPKIARCGMNRNTRARNASWFMKLAGLRSLVSGGVFYGPSGRRGTKDIMPWDTRTFSNSVRCLVGVALLSVMLFCALRLPAQEPSHTRGSVKGTVSLVNASQEPSTSEGLQLELKPLAEGAASLSAITDEPRNYQFKAAAESGEFLRLSSATFPALKTPTHPLSLSSHLPTNYPKN